MPRTPTCSQNPARRPWTITTRHSHSVREAVRTGYLPGMSLPLIPRCSRWSSQSHPFDTPSTQAGSSAAGGEISRPRFGPAGRPAAAHRVISLECLDVNTCLMNTAGQLRLDAQRQRSPGHVCNQLTASKHNTSSGSVSAVDKPFQFGQILISQQGLAGWERHKRTHLLQKTDKLL